MWLITMACMFIIPALGRLRKEDHSFKICLGHIARLCFRNSQSKILNKSQCVPEASGFFFFFFFVYIFVKNMETNMLVRWCTG